jgi:hypothetical protein
MTARLIFIAALAAALAGCIDSHDSVRLYAACSSPSPSATGGCTYGATCDAILIGGLEVDLALTGNTFYMPIQADNQRPSNSDRAGGTETATAWVDRYVVKYNLGALGAGSATIPGGASQPIPPAGSTVLMVPVFDALTGGVIANALTTPAPVLTSIEITAKGHYGDDSSFEAGPFLLNVTVCDNGTATSCASLPACAAGTIPAACPQLGQTATPACL